MLETLLILTVINRQQITKQQGLGGHGSGTFMSAATLFLALNTGLTRHQAACAELSARGGVLPPRAAVLQGPRASCPCSSRGLATPAEPRCRARRHPGSRPCGPPRRCRACSCCSRPTGRGGAAEMRLNPCSPFSTGKTTWGAGRSVCKEEGSRAAPSATAPGGLGLFYLRAILVWEEGKKTQINKIQELAASGGQRRPT